ncbi:hypothetical protein BDU57DRAFT_529418 [Ampelomyces quisqualis]|uniref:Uncharacterized protein n=1 Tax=Ampelomyces quisqualis TaxID=50730 RepID=A0A6A5QKR9_AMPQU|nr:hypothetical protein BDU57DRAFT_529418 [Ampelomyces quisqualis]
MSRYVSSSSASSLKNNAYSLRTTIGDVIITRGALVTYYKKRYSLKVQPSNNSNYPSKLYIAKINKLVYLLSKEVPYTNYYTKGYNTYSFTINSNNLTKDSYLS